MLSNIITLRVALYGNSHSLISEELLKYTKEYKYINSNLTITEINSNTFFVTSFKPDWTTIVSPPPVYNNDMSILSLECSYDYAIIKYNTKDVQIKK